MISITGISQPPLQIPYGLLDDHLVAPDEAPRGLGDVTCLDCGEPLVAARGDTVRPYFRHHSGIDHLCDYSGESVRHKLAKFALAERIGQALSDAEKLPIEWSCHCFETRHEGNLLKGATDYSLDDKRVGQYMPDIGIFRGDHCLVFVEIEQTHANSEEKIGYCGEKNISLVTVGIRDEADPVGFVRQTPLRVSTDVCLYWLGEVCHCEGRKAPKTDECIGCLRNRCGIDIDIAGSYKPQEPRFGAWAAIVSDADGTESEYTGQNRSTERSQIQVLRGALVKLESLWQGTYEVRIHSTNALVESQEGKRIFRGRSMPIRYWTSSETILVNGVPQPEREGKLVTDRPTLARSARMARERFLSETRSGREEETP